MIEFLLRLFFGYKYRKQEEVEQEEKKRIVAIVPTYNEDMKTLINTVESLLPQVDKIIVVDDGSDFNVYKYNLHVLSYKTEVITITNNGKANAIHTGMQYVPEDTDFVITCDSDTEFDKNFVKNALKRFYPSVGAVVGEVKIKNTTGFNNIFDVVYYYSFNVWRASMSYFGHV